jgi:magnesium chelatase accessory protein
VAAENDRSISPDIARRVREVYAQALIERVPGLGHLAHEEQPQLIADLITRYAAQANTADERTANSVN